MAQQVIVDSWSRDFCPVWANRQHGFVLQQFAELSLQNLSLYLFYIVKNSHLIIKSWLPPESSEYYEAVITTGEEYFTIFTSTNKMSIRCIAGQDPNVHYAVLRIITIPSLMVPNNEPYLPNLPIPMRPQISQAVLLAKNLTTYTIQAYPDDRNLNYNPFTLIDFFTQTQGDVVPLMYFDNVRLNVFNPDLEMNQMIPVRFIYIEEGGPVDPDLIIEEPVNEDFYFEDPA